MGVSERWLEPYLPEGGKVAVDVGANHGEWTRELATRFAKVYAVEPNPALEEELRSLGENVTVLPAGAWSSAGWRKFAVYEQDVHLSAMFYNGGIGTRQPIDTVQLWCQPLDEMPIEWGVQFLKIDTEAAEVEVVKGAYKLIVEHRPRMLIEVHTEENGALLQETMKGWNYRVLIVRHPYYAPETPLWRMHYWMICEPM